MPFAGAVETKVSFKRATAGSMGRFSGVASGITGAAVAIAGVFQLSGGVIARKVGFTRSVEGSFTWNGVGQRVYAKFTRSVAGAIRFSGNTAVSTGVTFLKRGLNRLGLKVDLD